MTDEVEGFEVGFSDATGDWHIVHKEWKGNVFHRTILAERYDSGEAAEETAAALEARE